MQITPDDSARRTFRLALDNPRDDRANFRPLFTLLPALDLELRYGNHDRYSNATRGADCNWTRLIGASIKEANSSTVR